MGVGTTSWQTELANVITEPQELFKLLELDLTLLPAAQEAVKLFPLRVPRGFVARMKKGDIGDPLLKQILPFGAELIKTPNFVADPLNEQAANPIPGVLHKYHGRILLTVVGSCAVNCRYCFRRYFPYDENNPGNKGWERALNYIENDPSLSEVILSGGDPLVAPDKYLAKLVKKIAEIPHIKTLRIHTRLPIVLPERITAELLEWFANPRLQPVMVIHCNHAQEIDANVISALQTLRQAGVTLLNQAVLLKGINDSVPSLCELSEKLFTAGVLPYYLHLLDKVQSTAHFEVEESQAKKLMQGVMQKLPGYLVPKLAREIPGESSKTVLAIR